MTDKEYLEEKEIENGEVETTSPEDIATENDANVSKFKNPEELAKAYEELEKEFTRRSQRLAKLEKELQEKDVVKEEDWEQIVDKFFEKTPAAKPFAKDMAREIIADPTLRDGTDCLEVALTRVLLSKYRTPEEMLSDGQFLKEHVLNSDAVKQAVIEDYLSGLKVGRPPVVMSDGGEVLVAPKSKPRTIEEAGAMFTKING